MKVPSCKAGYERKLAVSPKSRTKPSFPPCGPTLKAYMIVPESVSVAVAVQVTGVPTGCGEGKDPDNVTTGVAELDTAATIDTASTKANSKHLRALFVLFIFFSLKCESYKPRLSVRPDCASPQRNVLGWFQAGANIPTVYLIWIRTL